jgi:predicted alpha-1,2-mannosidase
MRASDQSDSVHTAAIKPRRGRGPVAAAALCVVLATVGALSGTTLAANASGLPASTSPSVPLAKIDLTGLVNPFIGTENEGLDFPAAGAPFGLVQESPLTKTVTGTGCDSESANTVTGFSQMTINGCRFNYLPMMPTTGAVTSTDPAQYASTFSHSTEKTSPDYYQSTLDKYGVTVGLTATARTGWQQYTFPRTTQANVMFNAGAGVTSSEIHVIGKNTIEGWVQDSKKTYFVAQLSRSFSSYGTWKGTAKTAGSRDSVATGSNGAWATFDTTKDDSPIVAKVGLSFTSLTGAQKNLTAETAHLGFDFDAAHKALKAQWNVMLHKAAVGGGSHDQQVAYYTALYHSMLDPNLIGDVDGHYVGADKKIHTAKGYTPYSNFSLWDTYRTQNELLETLVPKVAHDIDLSLIAIAREGGALPRWYLEDQEGNIMTGDPITPYLVEGWSKGLLTGAEAQEAYKYLRANATSVPPAGVREDGRAGVAYYASRGYIPYGVNITSNADCPSNGTSGTCCPTKGGDNDCYYGTSATLDYALADASLSLMAKGLHHTADAAMFAQRGQSYRNIYDSEIGQFRPRTQDGTWLSPYDPTTSDHAFHEQNASQYQWLVPQDPEGLVSMLGGKTATTGKLNDFFAYDQLVADPAGTAHSTWVSDPYDYYDSTKYNPNNEPNLVAPYLYAWTGVPGNTSTVVHAQETLYTNTPGGIPGNDDMGEMSAWFVMSSLGLYPTTSGGNFDVLTTPLFPAAQVQVGSYGRTQGGTLRISAPGTTMANRYIAKAVVNGKPSDRAWVAQADIAHGGSIDYSLSTAPTTWATAAKNAPPSIDTVSSDQREVSAQLSPTQSVVEPSVHSSSSQHVALSLLATAPGKVQIRLSVAAPHGWKVSPSSKNVTLASDGLPKQIKVPLIVTAPANTRPGTYTISVTVRMTGAATAEKQATVVVPAAARCAITTSTSCAVDLSHAYNNDGVATLADASQGDFDGTGLSFAANLLPAPGPVTLGGVTYQAPPTAGTQLNFVKSTGQALAIPSGTFSSLHIVGASDNGSTGAASATAVVTFTDGSTATVPLELTGWANAATDFANATVLSTPYQLKAGTGRTTTKASLYETDIPLAPGKTVRSLSLATPSVPAWVAPGSGGLDWARDSAVQIYAMTLTR